MSMNKPSKQSQGSIILQLVKTFRSTKSSSQSSLFLDPDFRSWFLSPFFFFFARPTEPLPREGGRWETKHFIGIAKSKSSLELYWEFARKRLSGELQQISWHHKMTIYSQQFIASPWCKNVLYVNISILLFAFFIDYWLLFFKPRKRKYHHWKTWIRAVLSFMIIFLSPHMNPLRTYF